MTERLGGPNEIVLRPGDVVLETIQREGHEPVSYLFKVMDINRNGGGQDYIWACVALGESDVSSAITLTLQRNERVGKEARISAVFTTDGGILRHTLQKTTAPMGVKWSYED